MLLCTCWDCDSQQNNLTFPGGAGLSLAHLLGKAVTPKTQAKSLSEPSVYTL